MNGKENLCNKFDVEESGGLINAPDITFSHDIRRTNGPKLMLDLCRKSTGNSKSDRLEKSTTPNRGYAESSYIIKTSFGTLGYAKK